MELSTIRAVTSFAATLEIPSIYGTPKVHYRIHKSSPLVPILSQTNPVLTTPLYPFKLYPNIVHPPGLPNSLFPSGFPTSNLYVFFSPILIASLNKQQKADVTLSHSSVCFASRMIISKQK
jgi:hypothetical protein